MIVESELCQDGFTLVAGEGLRSAPSSLLSFYVTETKLDRGDLALSKFVIYSIPIFLILNAERWRHHIIIFVVGPEVPDTPAVGIQPDVVHPSAYLELVVEGVVIWVRVFDADLPVHSVPWLLANNFPELKRTLHLLLFSFCFHHSFISIKNKS